MNIQEQVWYNRGKYHAYSIVLDLFDSPEKYKDFRSKIKRLMDRHYEQEKELSTKMNGMYIVKAHHRDTEETLYFHEWEELDEDGFDYDYYHEWSNCQASVYKDKEIALKSAIRFTGFTYPEFDYVKDIEVIKI